MKTEHIIELEEVLVQCIDGKKKALQIQNFELAAQFRELENNLGKILERVKKESDDDKKT